MNITKNKRNLKQQFFCILCIICFINAATIFAQDAEATNGTDGAHELINLLSIDTDMIAIARQNFGYGIGINYERKLTDYLSIRPGFGHMVCFTDMTFADVMAVTVNLQLNVLYYPFSNGLDKLYIGWGNGCDFIMYPNKDENEEDDVAISASPIIGWKWRATRYFMIEPHVGWRFYFHTTNNNENVGNFLDEGFQYGLSFKFFLTRRVYDWISRRRD